MMGQPERDVYWNVEYDGKQDEPPPWRPVLDPRAPLPSARTLVAAHYEAAGKRILQRHRGAFYEWNGACYLAADTEGIRSRIWSFLDQASRPDKKGKPEPFQPNRDNVGNVLDALSAVCNLPSTLEPPGWISDDDSRPRSDELLSVGNGLLHLPSGKLHASTPDYFNLNATGVRFDGSADAPEWLKFLDAVMPDDPQSIETLQDWFGYCLSPDTSQQKVLMMISPPRGGKGTIARILTQIIGQANVVNPTLASLATQFGLAELIAKPLAIITDARLGARADQSAIAERVLSVSGEDGQTIDRKYLGAWTGRLPTRFMILTNEVPRLADASGALASRFIVISMSQSFLGREDLGLYSRLIHELPGILNWAREGYRRLQSRGYFIQPESASEDVALLDELGAPLKAFVRERCSVSPGLQCTPEHLFSEWKLWCEASNRREAGTLQTFGRDLRAAVPGIRIVQPRVEGRQIRIYEGISINYAAC